MNATETSRDTVKTYETLARFVVGVALIAYAALAYFDWQNKAGPLGDAMAPLTGILTALALFAAIEGVRLQSKELKSQREQLELQLRELELQRKEFELSREVMKEQAAAAKESAEVQARLADTQESSPKHNELQTRSHGRTLGLYDVRREQSCSR